jgi:starch synthase
MRVLFLAAEAAPLVKIGGLGDVAGELPRTLRRLGIDVRLAIPRYPQLADQVQGQSALAVVEIPRPAGPLQAEVYETTVPGVRTWLIAGEPVDRAPAVYGDAAVDASKFTFFVLGALQACRATGWQPDVVHAHDWHTAPALAWMRSVGSGWESTAALLTVHNLPYMGAGGGDALAEYGLSPTDHPLLPDWARMLPLPLGMVYADFIAAVSPGYAAEIQTPSFGCGLELYLASRSDTVRGILNGIDTDVWDPARDQSLRSTYSLRSIDSRSPNKADLQRGVGLPVDPRTPLLAMVTRLDAQKGIDLALEAMARLAHRPWQLVLVGTGDPVLEDRARAFAASEAERVRFLPTFDAELARRVYAGADVILVPSLYEPCGLVQMIAMRYGALPIVRATGGLKDTIVAYEPRNKGTGFLFGPAEPQVLADAIGEALGVFEDPCAWLGLQQRAMAQDFSWSRSARAYADLYAEAVAHRNAGRRGVR